MMGINSQSPWRCSCCSHQTSKKGFITVNERFETNVKGIFAIGDVIGGAMLAHTFAALAARGQLRVELGVDAEGKTQPLRMYERTGMHVTFAYELYAKSLAA